MTRRMVVTAEYQRGAQESDGKDAVIHHDGVSGAFHVLGGRPLHINDKRCGFAHR